MGTEAETAALHPLCDTEEVEGDGRRLVLRKGLGSRPSDLRLCEATNRILASLSHPNVRPAISVERGDLGRLTLTYGADEFAPLGDVLGICSQDFALDVLESACAALDAAHGLGVIHGAINPWSVRIGRLDGQVEVSDFGLGHLFGSKSLVEDRARWLPYSPEKQLGLEPTPAEDVYLLGALGYALITGRPLFAAPTRRATLRQHAIETPVDVLEGHLECDAWLCTILARCLRKEPDERYPSPADLGAALRARRTTTAEAPPAAESKPVPKLPPPPVVGPTPPLRSVRPPPPSALSIPVPQPKATPAAALPDPSEPQDDAFVEALDLLEVELEGDSGEGPPPPPPPAPEPVDEAEPAAAEADEDADEDQDADEALLAGPESEPDATRESDPALVLPPTEASTPPARRSVPWPGIALAGIALAGIAVWMLPGDTGTSQLTEQPHLAAAPAVPQPADEEPAPEQRRPAEPEPEPEPEAVAPRPTVDRPAPPEHAPPARTAHHPPPDAPDVPADQAEPDPLGDPPKAATPDEDTELDNDGGEDPSEDPSDPAASADDATQRRTESHRLARDAEKARRAGNQELAIRLYRQALRQHASNAKAAHGLSVIYFNRGDDTNAIRYGKRATSSAPRRSAYRLHLGDCYYKAGQEAAARKQWTRAANLGNKVAARRLAHG